MSTTSTPNKGNSKGKSAVSTPGRGTDFPSLRGSPSHPPSSSSRPSDSPVASTHNHRRSTRAPTLSPSPASPIILPPIVKPDPCPLSEEVEWIHNLRRRCMLNTIRALSSEGKRQFREVGTWDELLDTLLEHQSEGKEENPKSKKGPSTPAAKGGARTVHGVGSEEGDIAKVMTHALELLYAVGDDHGEDWSTEIERSDVFEKLQTFIAATPSRYYKRQAALVYLMLNGKNKLLDEDPALDIIADIYASYHARLAPDNATPYPVWSSADANTGALYYARLEALSPLPRSPIPGTPSPGSRSPSAGRGRAMSPGGGFGTATLREAAAALAEVQQSTQPCQEAIEAGFATRFSDADPFAMLNHANKVLRMCLVREPENLRAVLEKGVVQNALAILGNADPLIAFYGEAFFHGIFARGRFVGQTLDPLYLKFVVDRIRNQELDRAEGNLQCLRELIDGKGPDTQAFVEDIVEAGVVELALQLLRDVVKKPPRSESAVWHSVPHLTGIIRCVVQHGAQSKPNTYRPLIEKEGGLKTLAELVTKVPVDGTGTDSACLAICALLEGEKPEPASLYGPVLKIVKNSMGRERHETVYNAAWAGLVNAPQILAEWEKKQRK